MTASASGRPPWEVVALGTGGIGCDIRRGFPALLFKTSGQRVLVDVGDGTIGQLARWDTLRRLDVVVLTAVTTERLGGLVTVLDTPPLRSTRELPLLIGPTGTAAALAGLKAVLTAGEPVSGVIEVQEQHELRLGLTTVDITVVDNGVSGPVLGLRVTEPEWPGRFDVAAAERLGLEPGPAFGRLQRGQSVRGVSPTQVMGPPRPGRKLTILGPCRPTTAAAKHAEAARALFVVAPYIDERQEVAIESGTMTGVEAALLGASAHVDDLVLMHASATARPGYARREAAQFHPSVHVASDGDEFMLATADDYRIERGRAVSHGGESHSS